MKTFSPSCGAARAILLLALSGSVSVAFGAPDAPPAPLTPVTNVVPETSAAPPRVLDAAQTKALQSAMKAKKWDAARVAVQSGADVNVADKSGVTPLMLACDAGQVGLVDLLLQSGANPNALDKRGQTALHYAVPADPKPKKKFGFGSVMGALGGASSVMGGLGGNMGGFGSLLGAQGLDSLMGANLTSLLGGQAFDLGGRSGWMAIAGAAIQGDSAGNFGVGQLLSNPLSNLNGNGLGASGWVNLLSSVKTSNPRILGAMGNLGTGLGADKAALWGQFLSAASSGNQSGVEQLIQNPDLVPLLKQASMGLGAATRELPGNAPRTIIGALVASGAQLNTPDEKGKTPLALAQERGVSDLFGAN